MAEKKKVANGAKKTEAKKSNGSSKKKNEPRISESFSIKVIVLIGVLVLAFFIFSSSVGDGIFEEDENTDETGLGGMSLEAFEYVNEYRVSNNLEGLRFSNNALVLGNEMSALKQVNSAEFVRGSDRTSFVNENLNVNNVTSSYVAIYDIEGLGISEFKRQFDDIYFIRNIVNGDRYDYGAVGCSEDYCSLVMFEIHVNATFSE